MDNLTTPIQHFVLDLNSILHGSASFTHVYVPAARHINAYSLYTAIHILHEERLYLKVKEHCSLHIPATFCLQPSKDHAPTNMALLQHIALNLLKQEKSTQAGINNKRKRAAWDNDYLGSVVCL